VNYLWIAAFVIIVVAIALCIIYLMLYYALRDAVTVPHLLDFDIVEVAFLQCASCGNLGLVIGTPILPASCPHCGGLFFEPS